MAQCKDCIHEKVCLHRVNIQTDTYAYMGVKYDTEKCEHYTTADVVPKSEVEKAKQEVARDIFKRIHNKFDYFKRYREVNDIIDNFFTLVEEVEKKYTESEDTK